MKALLAVFTLGLLSTSIFANEIPYQCIADKLQAMNSDIYYNVTESDINAYLQYSEFNYAHVDTLNALNSCDEEAKNSKFLTCIADRLQAYNSDIYYSLSNEEVKKMLDDTTEFGHFDAVRLSKYCK